MTMNLLYIEKKKACGRINQWQVITVVSTSNKKLSESPERNDMINQVNKVPTVINNIQSNCLGAKNERKSRVMDEDYHRNNKYEHNQMRQHEERSEGLQTCEILDPSVLAFGMDNIKNLRVKDLRLLICYHLCTEKYNGGPNKVELMEDITEFFIKYWGVLYIGRVVGGLMVL